MTAPYTPPKWLQDAVAEFGQECKERLQGGVGEPESAIRSPMEKLLVTISEHSNRQLIPHGETPLTQLGVRPDYAFRVDGAITGYLEAKRPGLNLDPSTFHGNNKRQWEQLRDLPDLIYTNGTEWCLYRHGEMITVAKLEGDLRTAGHQLSIMDDAFERLTSDFLLWSPRPITSVTQLVTDIAPLCRLLRSSVLDQLAVETKAIEQGADEWEQPLTGLARDWRNLLFPTASDETFADGYAQTLTFALLLARTEGIKLDRETSMHEISNRLNVGQSHVLMSKALQLLTDSATEQLKVTLDLLKRVVGAVQWEAIRDTKSDAYLHLYESFLEVYDPKLREDSGTYYTPYQVVDAMVRLTQEVIRTRLGMTAGFLSPAVTTVDPAMGTGAFLNSIIEQSAEEAAEVNGPGSVPSVISDLAKRLIGFELQMGSYAVAEMRVADLLKTYGAHAPTDGMRLYVTNTLDDPFIEQAQIAAVFEPIARSRRRANKIKADIPVTVVIGNPPWDEHAQGKGGWVELGGHGSSAPLDRFRLSGNGLLEYVLKSFYIYFYAWATWKVFEANAENRHGVVTFISTAGYLTGPGFKGMRRYLRTTCSEGWIINVSPEGIRPDVATRLFPTVQQPAAIGIFVRKADANPNLPAQIHYAEVTGHREDKFGQLAELQLDDINWRPVRTSWEAPFTPAAMSAWDDYPALNDLFPWVTPGITPGRTWVYAPSTSVLQDRWKRLIGEKDRKTKLALLKKTDGHDLDTKVPPLPYGNRHTKTIAEEIGPCPSPHRIGFRSFDRQWVIPDQRVIDRPRAELWASEKRHNNLFLIEQHTEPISSGPGVVFSTLIPDKHYFKGSEGGRVLSLLHPDGTPNIAMGLLDILGGRFKFPVSAQDIAAYVAAVTSHPGFTAQFGDELVTPGIRVPLTGDADLFQRAVVLGEELIWAATYGRAYVNHDRNRLDSIAYPIGDARRIRNLTSVEGVPTEIAYDQETGIIHVGTGSFGPVPERVWTYDVGGMHVVKHWFDYRKAKPSGKRTSPLDDIRANEWPVEWISEFNELLTALRRVSDLETEQATLLGRILDGPIITRDELTNSGVKFPANTKDRRPRGALSEPENENILPF